MPDLICKLTAGPEEQQWQGLHRRYFFWFEAVPEELHGTVHEPGARLGFVVELRVGRQFSFSGSWRCQTPESMSKALFQIVKDHLQAGRDPRPGDPRPEGAEADLVIELSGGDHPLADGPEAHYDLEKIEMGQPFRVPGRGQSGPIGFTKG